MRGKTERDTSLVLEASLTLGLGGWQSTRQGSRHAERGLPLFSVLRPPLHIFTPPPGSMLINIGSSHGAICLDPHTHNPLPPIKLPLYLQLPYNSAHPSYAKLTGRKSVNAIHPAIPQNRSPFKTTSYDRFRQLRYTESTNINWLALCLLLSSILNLRTIHFHCLCLVWKCSSSYLPSPVLTSSRGMCKGENSPPNSPWSCISQG